MNYKITGANKETGADVTITVEARGFHHAEEQANELHILVSNVTEVAETQEPPAAPPPPQLAPAQPRTAACQTCGGGPLHRKRVHRMSAPVVVIGYILLIPSFLGMLLNGVLLIAPFIGLAANDNDLTTEVYTEQMQESGVDDVIIQKVLNDEVLSPTETDSMTAEQNQVISAIQLTRMTSDAGACCALGIWGGGAIVGLVVCFVGGLLGWLLVMKKRILQCARCQAVVAAS